MKSFVLYQVNLFNSQLGINRKTSIAARLICAVAMSVLSACGGNSAPEPKTIELFMQSGGLFISEPGGSCGANAPIYASRFRSFEQDVLRKDLNLKVISAECRFLPKGVASVPGNFQCAAEYRYVIAAEGAIQTRKDIVTPENDSYFYSPDDYFGFYMFPWGARNETTQSPPSVFEVKFPPKFTAGYVSCGG